ncbi:hypothetical protein BVX98_06600 [bacterium F11]|nr:hypothetical protein BVX98_06600 [bacterium F11]
MGEPKMITRLIFLITVAGLLTSCGSSTKSDYSEGPRTLVFFGDSLTAGKGVTSEEAYPHLIQEKIDEMGWDIKVVNAGISGDTSTDGLNRIHQVLEEEVHYFVLALGANDMLRKNPASIMGENLQKILDLVKEKNPEAKQLLVGVKFGLVLGMFVSRQYKDVFSNLAEENDVEYVPNLLKGVVGKPQLNSSDGIHPNPDGHKKLAATVWKKLQPLLED